MNKQQDTISDIKLGDYKGIRIASIIFLIIVILVVFATINISRSLSYDSQAIDIAGRQRMLSQNIAKNVSILNNKLTGSEGGDYSVVMEQLAKSYKTFDDTLYAFANGGDTLNTQGGTATLKKITTPSVRKHVTDAQEIWEGLKPNLDKVISSEGSPDLPQYLGILNDKVTDKNLTLLKLMNNTTVGLKLEARKRASMQTNVSIAALVATIAYFIYLVTLSLSKLKKRDTQLMAFSKTLQSNNATLEMSNNNLVEIQESLTQTLSDLEVSRNDAVDKAVELEKTTTDLTRLRDESDKIFSTVDHGLCLLNPDMKIGDRVSKATFDIFEKGDLSGMSFIHLMRPVISDKDLDTLTKFLKLQFEGKAMSAQLDKFNPLKSVELTLNWDGSNFKNKHVGFDFERIMNEGKVEQVLVTITDITERVILERSLEQAEKEQALRSQIIGELMTVDHDELNRVVVQSERAINEINELLREKNISGDTEIPSEVRVEIVNEVFRKIHTIKGNASMIGLTQLAENAHTVEGELSGLKQQSSLTGESLLGALVSLSTLRECIESYQDIKDTFTGKFGGSTAGKKAVIVSKEEQLADQLQEFGNQIGSDEGKKVQLVSNLDFSALSDDKVNTIKDIYIQLLRNSVIHGIETPEERQKKGKVEEGIIYVSSKPVSGGKVKFTFRDDGKGLDLDLIKKKVVDLGLLPADAPELESPQYLAKMIFAPNFSTKETASEHAGRGVGMDVVKSAIVEELGGKMSMSYSKGQYTEFTWEVPA